MKTQEATFQKAKEVFEAYLLSEIERLAKGVIDTHPWAESFCMAMGSASFHCKWEEKDDFDPTDIWDRDDQLSPLELSKGIMGNSFAFDLDNLLSKWDREFCLTGHPMRITKDFVTGKLVTINDW